MAAISDLELMRYIDNELPPGRAAEIEAQLAHDTKLRARMEVFVMTREPFAAPFDAILDEPVPQRLIDAILRAAPAPQAISHPPSGPAPTVRKRLVRTLAARWPRGFSPALAAGLAAAVVAGSVGWMAGRAAAPSAALIATSGSELIATGALADALEHTASAARFAGPDATIQPVLSFRTTSGAICREYRIHRHVASGPNFAGLGCRTESGVWRVALHVETPKTPAPSGGSTTYETAGAQQPVPALDAFIDTIMAGDALGTEDEANLLRRGWTAP